LLWKIREFQLHLNIAVSLIQLKDFTQASLVLNGAGSAMANFESAPPTGFYERCTSAIGRCFLQLGDVEEAEQVYFFLNLML
jgi:hypothetical protein